MLLIPETTASSSPARVEADPNATTTIVHARLARATDPLASSTIRTLIAAAPEAAALSTSTLSHIYATIECESTGNPQARGDGSTSFGIVQIHLPAHPDITEDQALDPVFSIRWMVAQVAAGRAGEWSCWHMTKG